MIQIFLLAGQSNMRGRAIAAQLPPRHRVCPSNVRLFENNDWQPLLSPSNFGPELGLAHALAPAFPNDNIVLCKIARSGANLHYDWNPDGTSRGSEDIYRGPMYPNMIAELKRLRERLVTETGPAVLAALFWMQGERDAVFEFMAQAYERQLAAFIAAVRNDTGYPKLPVLIGQIAPRIYRLDDGHFQHPFRRMVQDAQRKVADNAPLVALVETMDLPQCDNLHFDTGGQIELGKRFAEAYISIRTPESK